MSLLQPTFLVLYFGILSLMAVIGVHRYMMLYLYHKHRHNDPQPKRVFPTEELPRVTIQLPVFNELFVVDRLIDTVCLMDYPKHLLDIQVLDDSTDETTELCRKKVEEYQAKGFDIHLLHREDRTGFKAGALKEGILSARGEFVAMFDADFVPPTDFLQKSIHYFSDPKVGLVQSRWGHLNRDYNLLTEIQSILLDGHLVIEQVARNRSGRFFNFNGTGGIWRLSTIEEAGGWQGDTLTEDLDLSFRAQLKDWQFIFLKDLVSPAELPIDFNSYKTQQHRWAKGYVQTCRKLLPDILRSKYPLHVKAEAALQLTMHWAYMLMVILMLLMLPAVTLKIYKSSTWVTSLLIDLPLCLATTTSVFSFYLWSQRESLDNWTTKIKYLPFTISIGIAMCLSNTKAVLEAVFGHETPFVRTPKYGVESKNETIEAKSKYSPLKNVLPIIELSFAIYLGLAIYAAIITHRWLSLPFLTLFQFGFMWVGVNSLRDQFRRQRSIPEPIGLEEQPVQVA